MTQESFHALDTFFFILIKSTWKENAFWRKKKSQLQKCSIMLMDFLLENFVSFYEADPGGSPPSLLL